MPTYHARGISIHLGTSSLSRTTTAHVALRKGEAARRNVEDAEKHLMQSTLLPEQRVNFPGDPQAFELNWLGNAPFMQVQRSIMNNDLTGESLSSHPKALSLHVKLSDKTFVSGLGGNKTSLKIEVLFNGKLANCSFIPVHDVRSGVKSLHQVFAGTRIDFLAERPWIIFPTEDATDDLDHICSSFDIHERWQHICHEVRIEAKQRGTDKDGCVPPSAEFLTALANMEMPIEVANMQERSKRQFGIIDVIISAGEGMKVTRGTSYLKAPRRLQDENFVFTPSDGELEEHLNGYISNHGSSTHRIETPSDNKELASSASELRFGDPTYSPSVFNSPFRLPLSPYRLPFPTPLRDAFSPVGFSSIASSTVSSRPSPVFIGLSPCPLPSRVARADQAPFEIFEPRPPVNSAHHNEETCPFLDCANVPSYVHGTPSRGAGSGYGTQNLVSPMFSTPIPYLPPSTPTMFGLDQQLNSSGSWFPASRARQAPALLPPAGLYTVPTKPKSRRASSRASSPEKMGSLVDETGGHYSRRTNSSPVALNTQISRSGTTHNTPDHGTQGPKGSSSPWVEASEENKTNALESQRMSSPTKRKDKPNFTIQTQVPSPKSKALGTSEASSSPLSSVPDTPASSPIKLSFTDAPPATISPHLLKRDSVVQTSHSPDSSFQIPNKNLKALTLTTPFFPRPDHQPQPHTPIAPPISPFTPPGYAAQMFSSPARLSPARTSSLSPMKPGQGTRKRASPSNNKIDTDEHSSPPKRRSNNPVPRTPKTPAHTTAAASTASTPLSGLLPPSAKRSPGSKSPTRFTLSDPPLNANCVIGYAGTAIDTQTGEERPVLRQVRGERQGVFREEYVVFGGRFYVC